MKKTMRIRTYTEVSRISDYYERFRYLQVRSHIGVSTFGWERYLNQILYQSTRWRKLRNQIIIRDEGCDLAHPDYEIPDGVRIVIHHLNPITPEQVEVEDESIFDPEFLICTTDITHKAIHYGDEDLLPKLPIERRPGDMCPWR